MAQFVNDHGAGERPVLKQCAALLVLEQMAATEHGHFWQIVPPARRIDVISVFISRRFNPSSPHAFTHAFALHRSFFESHVLRRTAPHFLLCACKGLHTTGKSAEYGMCDIDCNFEQWSIEFVWCGSTWRLEMATMYALQMEIGLKEIGRRRRPS